MSGKNILELNAGVDIDGQTAFETSFPATGVHEVLLEFDPKRTGPPICVLSNPEGGSQEIHPLPLRGREGRYCGHVAGGSDWTKVRVTTARDVHAKLLKVKLIGKIPAQSAE